MSRSNRLATVVRVRRLQARQAEIETVQRRIEADRCREARAAAVEQLAERSGAEAADVRTRDSLTRRADVLRGAADDIELRGDIVDAADAATREAEAIWLAAHRRQDAVERLSERHHAAELVEQQRNEQKELDDLVSVRHARPGATP